MALSKETRHNARGRGNYRVECREITIIKDGTKEVSENLKIKLYFPDSDWSDEPTKIQTICDLHFTNDIKTAWAALSDIEKQAHQ